MEENWIIICAAITAFSALAFFAVGILWLRKVRHMVLLSISEVVSQHVRTSQRLDDSVAQIQKQHRQYEQQIQTLAQAGLRLRQELTNVSTRLEHTQSETIRGDQTVH